MINPVRISSNFNVFGFLKSYPEKKWQTNLLTILLYSVHCLQYEATKKQSFIIHMCMHMVLYAVYINFE